MSLKKLALLFALFLPLLSATTTYACEGDASRHDSHAGRTHALLPFVSAPTKSESDQSGEKNAIAVNRSNMPKPLTVAAQDPGEEEPSAGGPCIHANGCTCKGQYTTSRLCSNSGGVALGMRG